MPKPILETSISYTDCISCHNPLPHCHCVCLYCGQRDECDCVLFDVATGG
ncbi:MAG: hypothetical protein ITD40_06000 [Nitrosarchaeum sp.]|nr:hypothetical protein [Nitrosarchaeum sp.]